MSWYVRAGPFGAPPFARAPDRPKLDRNSIAFTLPPSKHTHQVHRRRQALRARGLARLHEQALAARVDRPHRGSGSGGSVAARPRCCCCAWNALRDAHLSLALLSSSLGFRKKWFNWCYRKTKINLFLGWLGGYSGV